MVNCRQCKHYYVTWDRKFPHGCRPMRIKSGQLPSNVVYQSSGKECLAFQAKGIHKEGSRNLQERDVMI